LIAWRLTTKKNENEAFNGIGASKYGGRWNSKGNKVIYSSESISLALLENLVHFDLDLSPKLYLFEIKLNGLDILQEDLSKVDIKNLNSSRDFGDLWLKNSRSLALKVPSIIVPSESNILINPDHPKFKGIKIIHHGPFEVDSRFH